MTEMTDLQRSACCFAAAQGLPFAVWRKEGDQSFTVIVSTSQPVMSPVFEDIQEPGFVMAPFRCEDGSQAHFIHADIMIDNTGIRYWGGQDFTRTAPNKELNGLSCHQAMANLHAPDDHVSQPAKTSRAEYEERVRKAICAIRSGVADKIVLSRVEPRQLPEDYDLFHLVESLARVHSHAFVCLVTSKVTGTWLVATPEVLLSSNAAGVRTMALAGTQWPEEGEDLQSLTWTDKIVQEQAIVSDYIRNAFDKAGIEGVRESAPRTVRAANLCHLRSDFVASSCPTEKLQNLLRLLHPTSAVCGSPRDIAHEFILEQEGDTRGFYTGYLGPRAVNGETSLYVNLRSARIAQNQIFLHVGGGIVLDSDPELEWQETVQKTMTIGQIL